MITLSQVRRIGYGSMQLQRPDVTHADGVALVRAALDLGVDHIDTAPFYGTGKVMRILGEALADRRDDVCLVSKVGLVNDERGAFAAAQRPEQIREQVHASLALLGTDPLDVVNLRRMDDHDLPADQQVAVDDQLAVLAELREEGLIRGIGLSHVSLEQVEHAVPLGLECVQNAYNLLLRRDEPVLTACERAGVAFVPYFPLGSAVDRFPSVADDPDVRAVAAQLDVTPAQVGLAWLLRRSPSILLIPGTTSEAHLRENLAAAEVQLPDGILAG